MPHPTCEAEPLGYYRRMIVRTSKGWQVRSEKGKNLSADDLSKDEAKKRLAMVEFFKRSKKGRKG